MLPLLLVFLSSVVQFLWFYVLCTQVVFGSGWWLLIFPHEQMKGEGEGFMVMEDGVRTEILLQLLMLNSCTCQQVI